jgi:hypothetical protein
MAWLDDRVWSHPKFADLTAHAFRAYVYGVCYSSGFGTRGKLTPGMLTTIGAKPAMCRELITAGLWDEDPPGISIHDWDEHNGKRDDRRERDRERKRRERARDDGRPHDSPEERPADSPLEVPVEVRQERRVVKVVKEVTDDKEQTPTPGLDNGHSHEPEEPTTVWQDTTPIDWSNLELLKEMP